MSEAPNLVLRDSDFQQLIRLVQSSSTPAAEMLEEELSRAAVVEGNTVPENVVTMNSTVRFKDLESGQESSVTLVYPHEARIEENKISILAPVGSALIGLRVGQVISWPVPSGKEKKLQVIAVSQGQ